MFDNIVEVRRMSPFRRSDIALFLAKHLPGFYYEHHTVIMVGRVLFLSSAQNKLLRQILSLLEQQRSISEYYVTNISVMMMS